MFAMKPWLWLPSQLAHDLAQKTLPLTASLFSIKKPLLYREKSWRGLYFPNPIGIAGGMDKTGDSPVHWQKLGAGFTEIGTVTPRPQGPNPGKIMDRDNTHEALWNKMGFPGPGAQAVKETLLQLKPELKIPLFVNIGKNRDTTNEKASEDYISGLHTFSDIADVFVINVSSPNTKGLRDLLKPQSLKNFLEPLIAAREHLKSRPPLLIKLSPDMEDTDFLSCLKTTVDLNIDGWILTNTTQARTPDSPFPNEGGVSGSPLTEQSRKWLMMAQKYLGPQKQDKLLVSVGGIMNAQEIQTRLDLGADLVQMYSAFVFQGPFFIQNSIKRLKNKQ
ncbi:MAG: quinone-dependent dihydroorotate dehydrogenase [Bdellovibrionaceae bacterium]|nr:quinone-dependent dihydroorotate dehydrogenase [Pseudobdellovibrionaceae bacterium]